MVMALRGGVSGGTLASMMGQQAEVRASERLEATVPIGDGEFLDRLRERTTGAVTRPAGSTVLLDAIIPPQRPPTP